MLMNRHNAARQAVTPPRLGDLEQAPLQSHGVVLVDRALMLQTQHPVQIPPATGHKGGARLTGRDGKLSVELRDVALAEELVSVGQRSALGTSQFLRQSSLPGAIVAFHSPPRLRRI